VADQRRGDGKLVGTPDDGYAAAQFIWQTPYKTITEWRRAMIAAIPEAERCTKCKGSGSDVILASNGGVGEVVRCWPCQGTGRCR
jgi:hypothetical protein